MSTDQRNNGNVTPPSTPHGDKDIEKNPETEEQEEEVTEQEGAKQRKLEALKRILDVEEKKANEKLECIHREKQCAGALLLDIKAHRLDNHGEAELEGLLRGLSPRRSEVSNETNDKSTSEEDIYQVPPEKDGGRKRHWAKKKREKKGKEKQLGRLEKQRRTEKALPETEDPEVRRLDEADAWVGVQCLLPPANSRKKVCRYCCLRKVKCSNLLENENRQPTVQCRVPEVNQAVVGLSRQGGWSSGRRVLERDINLLMSRVNEADLCAEHKAMLWHLALRVLHQDMAVDWACQYLHVIGQNSDGDSESSSLSLGSLSEEEDEEVKHVKTWVKKVGASQKDGSSRSEHEDGGADGDGDVEMEGPSMEVVPLTETVDGPAMFGLFAMTSDGIVFHINMECMTVVVNTKEEEGGIPHNNEEDLVRRGRLQKKNKAKEAEKTAEEGPETEVKTEEQEVQVPVQRPAPCIVQAPSVFFKTATSTGKLILVQVEMIEVLNSNNKAPAP
ncbi:hypothetical protein C8R45DRAFT_1115865 [Mycena sanguinolenta]|nr:hypothetical protein C8R45DRAFT_1115865 [Mycena sanguinolenta]